MLDYLSFSTLQPDRDCQQSVNEANKHTNTKRDKRKNLIKSQFIINFYRCIQCKLQTRCKKKIVAFNVAVLINNLLFVSCMELELIHNFLEQGDSKQAMLVVFEDQSAKQKQ